ncbi:3-oxoacyl-[acyl-carrier protein] reductase [Scopulibacillus daqui]|uniref:3-oxoacyl-[acyl-carrier protein] reductase n=1 Tax=Scopulibacillus daqui TaxID=1469162 RepID=A0ABS2PY75_9BACL|nr:SDR family oxidoreductase [Scopulibacillus daqui]MBM7644811.1 3-oxoacyl-[acyl-carrier protein] reductase [Scopulibacillus daqui]
MRHILITAGSKGIGRMVTEKFLQQGYSVTVNYRSDEKAVEQMKEKWKDSLDRLQFVKGDITKRADIIELVDKTMTRFNRIDGLINNAGPFIFERKKLIDHSDEEWEEMIDGNLSAVFHLVKRVVPVMRQQRFGRIITYGFQDAGSAPGWIDRGAFAAAKTGAASLTRTLAIEEAEFGITANMVCPGMILSDMKESTIDEARRLNEQRTPLGRSVTGEDIANMILFLSKDDTEMVTGSVIDVTGAVEVINRFRPAFE